MAARRRIRPPVRGAAGPRASSPTLRFEPATAANWSDLCALFGANGACGGCWCMTMRLRARDYEAQKGAANRAALQRRVASGHPPGLLGYLGDTAVAWISLGPRDEFERLRTSRVLAPVDELPVWSIVCMFVRRDLRGCGVSTQLVRAAAAHARRAGARILEGYPHEPSTPTRMPDVFAWTGLATSFRRAGFVEVARRSATRPIFRLALGAPDGTPRRRRRPRPRRDP